MRLITIVTILGLQLGALLSGSVVTETVFSYPGIGDLLIQSISARDYKLTQSFDFDVRRDLLRRQFAGRFSVQLDRSEDQVLMISYTLSENLGRRRDLGASGRLRRRRAADGAARSASANIGGSAAAAALVRKRYAGLSSRHRQFGPRHVEPDRLRLADFV